MVQLKEWQGCVLNIQSFSLHDGPGIRNVVFLKGCPLKCRWCSNPESQSAHPELLFKKNRCLGKKTCGVCIPACSRNAVCEEEDGSVSIDRQRCDHCGECVRVCPSQALEMAGRSLTVQQVILEVEKDSGFHFRSNGGVTVSGGEPLVQAEFVNSLLKACKQRLIHTSIETCGYGSWNHLKTIVSHADLIHYDIKCLDPGLHKTVTGHSNVRILDNLVRLSGTFPDKPIIVRTPVIPGVNDTRAAIASIVKFITPLLAVVDFQLMPYHRFGQSKYEYQGKASPMGDTDPPNETVMSRLNRLITDFPTKHCAENTPRSMVNNDRFFDSSMTNY